MTETMISWRAKLCALGLAGAAVALVCAGCVQRRMTIRSNPPGAAVYVDNYPIGVTPVSTSFVYYGTRQFRLVRDGYETLTIEQKVRAPWYQWFGVDFFTENLVPFNIRDEQSFDFQMVPQRIPATPELGARAENLRAVTQAQRTVTAVPQPQFVPGSLPPPAPVQVLPEPGQRVPPPGAMPPPGSVPPAGTIPPNYVIPAPGSAQPQAGVRGPSAGQVPAPGAPATIPGPPPGWQPPPGGQTAPPPAGNYSVPSPVYSPR